MKNLQEKIDRLVGLLKDRGDWLAKELAAGHRPSELLQQAGVEPPEGIDAEFAITVAITVTQLVEDDELDSDDAAENPAGEYEVTVSGAVPPAVAVSIALDAFASEIPIGCLDDFTIACSIDREEVDQSDDEGYSHCGEAWSRVRKV